MAGGRAQCVCIFERFSSMCEEALEKNTQHYYAACLAWFSSSIVSRVCRLPLWILNIWTLKWPGSFQGFLSRGCMKKIFLHIALFPKGTTVSISCCSWKMVMSRSGQNATVVVYINCQGCTCFVTLHKLSLCLIMWSSKNLLPTHVPGVLNTRADLLSRGKPLCVFMQCKQCPLFFKKGGVFLKWLVCILNRHSGSRASMTGHASGAGSSENWGYPSNQVLMNPCFF